MSLRFIQRPDPDSIWQADLSYRPFDEVSQWLHDQVMARCPQRTCPLSSVVPLKHILTPEALEELFLLITSYWAVLYRRPNATLPEMAAAIRRCRIKNPQG